METFHFPVRRTARFFVLDDGTEGDTLGVPIDSVWFVLHGYRQTADRFLARFTGLQRSGRLVVAPEGLSRFYVDEDGGPHGVEHRVGASWMTREDRQSEITDYVAYLDGLRDHVVKMWAASKARIVVLGFSQGAHTATRWVAQGTTLPSELVLWGAGLPRDIGTEEQLQRLRRLHVSLVRGTEDPLAPEGAFQRERKRFAELGVPLRTLDYPGGHDIHPGALRDLEAMVEPPAKGYGK